MDTRRPTVGVLPPGFSQAVKENLLTDYRSSSDGQRGGGVPYYQAIAEMGGELNLDTAAKLTGC